MEINKKKLAKSELIGLNVKVVGCDNPSNEGINGKIINSLSGQLYVDGVDDRVRIQIYFILTYFKSAICLCKSFKEL